MCVRPDLREDSVNLGFFERLYEDQEFCNVLGKMTLAAGRFESNLRAFLNLSGVGVPEGEATLGSLISKLKKHDLLSENGVQVLRDLKRQRNYLTHSLFDLFSARVDETVLPRPDLVPMDVTLFTEKAWQLEQNLSGLSSIVEERIAQLGDVTRRSSVAEARLFRP
jgi:hypothetical protein